MTLDSLAELVTITKAKTRPTTSSIAAPAATHSQRGDFGGAAVGWELKGLGGDTAPWLPVCRELFGRLGRRRAVAGAVMRRSPVLSGVLPVGRVCVWRIVVRRRVRPSRSAWVTHARITPSRLPALGLFALVPYSQRRRRHRAQYLP